VSAILVCVEYSRVLPNVLVEARRLCIAMNSTAHVLHVVPPETDVFLGAPGSSVHFHGAPDIPAELKRLDDHCCEQLSSVPKLRCRVIVGSIVHSILQEADAVSAWCIVAGSTQRGFFRKLLDGGILSDLLYRSRIPVVVVPTTLRGRNHSGI
jgi:nucleotide-binding universal stress UspA family protein